MARRKFKEIPEEDLQELNNFLEKTNKEESVLLSTRYRENFFILCSSIKIIKK